jgi:hypothetical protein
VCRGTRGRVYIPTDIPMCFLPACEIKGYMAGKQVVGAVGGLQVCPGTRGRVYIPMCFLPACDFKGYKSGKQVVGVVGGS